MLLLRSYGGFGGRHAMIVGGYSQITDAMAQGLDVRLGMPVSRVEWCGQSPPASPHPHFSLQCFPSARTAALRSRSLTSRQRPRPGVFWQDGRWGRADHSRAGGHCV